MASIFAQAETPPALESRRSLTDGEGAWQAVASSRAAGQSVSSPPHLVSISGGVRRCRCDGRVPARTRHHDARHHAWIASCRGIAACGCEPARPCFTSWPDERPHRDVQRPRSSFPHAWPGIPPSWAPRTLHHGRDRNGYGPARIPALPTLPGPLRSNRQASSSSSYSPWVTRSVVSLYQNQMRIPATTAVS